MDGYRAAAAILPRELRPEAERLTPGEKRRCEEFRLRRGHPPTALIAGRETTLGQTPVTEAHLRAVLEAASRSSLHAAEAELRRGYLSAPGGVRVGVCGVGVTGEAGPVGLRSFSSLAVRVPHAVPGCADGVWREVTEGGFHSLLVVSPPGAGKTTLLRELIRRLSEAGERVCVADERGELAGAGCDFDLGPHTDVMTGIPKAAAAGMLLRSMNPQIIAMDEIADEAEGEALLAAVGCGVSLLASAHGDCVGDARRHPACRRLLDTGAFHTAVTILCAGGIRSYRTEALG